MEALLRRFNDNYYVWKNVTWQNGRYYVDGTLISQTSILAIKDDNRGKYVQCMHCGAIINDDPECIERHFAEQEANKNCFECGSLRVNNKRNLLIVYEKNDDGTYHQTATSDVNLCCSQTWPSHNIDTIDVNRFCVYYRCRKSGVMPISDVFMKYPGPFEKQLTVDFLKEKGFAYEEYTNGYFEYDLKMRGTLKAYVNELGVVDHFAIKGRWDKYTIYYSDKYDEIFYVQNGNYVVFDEQDDVSSSKHNSVKAKISALYKEVNK